MIKEAAELLVYFKEATTQLSAEKTVTISLVIPVVQGIKSGLVETPVSTTTGKSLQKELMKAVDKRLTPYETDLAYAVPTFLDPRFKNELSTVVAVDVYTEIQKKLRAAPRQQGEVSVPVTSVVVVESTCDLVPRF